MLHSAPSNLKKKKKKTPPGQNSSLSPRASPKSRNSATQTQHEEVKSSSPTEDTKNFASKDDAPHAQLYGWFFVFSSAGQCQGELVKEKIKWLLYKTENYNRIGKCHFLVPRTKNQNSVSGRFLLNYSSFVCKKFLNR